MNSKSLPLGTLVPGNQLAIMINLLDNEGIDCRPLLRQLNIEYAKLYLPETYISAELVLDFICHVKRTTPDETLWFRFGDQLTIGAHGTTGIAIMSCQNLEEVFKLLFKYYRLLTPFVELDLKEGSSHIYLQVIPASELSVQSKEIIETLFRLIVCNFKVLLNLVSLDLEFHFNFPQPNNIKDYQYYLGENLQFDQSNYQIKIPKEYLTLPIVFSNQVMQNIYERQCEQLLEQQGNEQDIVTQVKQLILATPEKFPSFEQIAKQLHTNTRTLRRQLNACGISYQGLANTIKADLAIKYLSETTMTIEDIATSLDYSDAANFRRAFKKLTGKVPSAYRS